MTLAPADFSERLVPRSAKAPQAPDRGAEAENASAAFSHYTEGFRVGARGTTVRPVATANPNPAGRTVSLTEHAMILLRAVATYEECSNERAVMLALADYVKKIGCGPLARAVLDESERLGALAGSGDHLADDLADLPDFRRRAQSRFVDDAGTGEPDRNFSRGLRR